MLLVRWQLGSWDIITNCLNNSRQRKHRYCEHLLRRDMRWMFSVTVHVLLSNFLKLWTALLIVPAENCPIRSSATYFRNCFGVVTYVGYVTGQTWYLHSFQIWESLGDHCSFFFLQFSYRQCWETCNVRLCILLNLSLCLITAYSGRLHSSMNFGSRNYIK